MSYIGTIFQCFRKLVTAESPKGELSSASYNIRKGHQLNDSLTRALTSLKAFLENDVAAGPLPKDIVHCLLSTISSDAEYLTDVRWNHTKCLLILLDSLHLHLQNEIKLFRNLQSNVKKTKSQDVPPLAPDSLSIGHQQILSTVLQFVVSMGICTYLSKGVGIPLQLRSGFSDMFPELPSLSKCTINTHLFEVVRTLLTCIAVPSLGGLILSRHLGDLLSALLQLLHEPQMKVEKEAEISTHSPSPSPGVSIKESSGIETDEAEQTRQRKYCEENLRRILEQAYQPAVIRELLILQGGPGSNRKREKGKYLSKNPLPRSPVWLRSVCADLLVKRIMQMHGVQHLLRSVLDVSGEPSSDLKRSSSLDWQKCDAVTNILTEYHASSVSEEEYFKAIYPQILQLLDYEDPLILKQVLRVCCTTIRALVDKKPKLTQKYLIAVIQDPFLKTLEISCMQNISQTEVVTIATEDSLIKCLENLRKIYLEGVEPSSALLDTLLPILLPLYQLYSCTKGSNWTFRSVLEQLLLLGLQSCDHAKSVELVAFITEVKGHDEYSVMHNDVNFVPGSLGEFVAVQNPSKSSDEQFSDSVFQGEQSAACCTELLLAGKGKLDKVAADFFILILKELSLILDEKPQEPVDNGSNPEELLLKIESRQTDGISRIKRSLRVLSLVSSLCQGLGPTVLQSVDHMILFAHASLERACKHLHGEEAMLLGSFEAETVMFAFGLLSTLLVGTTKEKVTPENRESLQVLLPLLEKISLQHPSETLKTMAADLRITIATHGAVWTENTIELLDKLRKNDGNIEKSREPLTIGELEPKEEEKTVSDETEDASHVKKKEKSRKEKKAQINRNKTLTDGGGGNDDDDDRSKMNQIKSEVYDKAYEELFDPLAPVRGHALIALSRLIKERDPKAIQEQDKLLKLFLEHLSDDDSYVYLTAVGALVSLADRFTADVIPTLCAEYSNEQITDRRSKVKRSVETRLKLGEALVKATRLMGEMAPLYSKQLLNVFLSGTKDEDEHIRASSLSNLGEICQLLRFSLASSVHEIFQCLTSVLQTDPAITVRRACVLVLSLLLRGCGADALELLETEMRDLYRLLKLLTVREKDDVMLMHVQIALEELDVIMRKYLFPPQTLSKKIIVLP